MKHHASRDRKGTAPTETLELEDCVNETCPWSGKPVQGDSLTLYKGEVVGFCNLGCKEKFEYAIGHFEAALDN